MTASRLVLILSTIPLSIAITSGAILGTTSYAPSRARNDSTQQHVHGRFRLAPIAITDVHVERARSQRQIRVRVTVRNDTTDSLRRITIEATTPTGETSSGSVHSVEPGDTATRRLSIEVCRIIPTILRVSASAGPHLDAIPVVISITVTGNGPC